MVRVKDYTYQYSSSGTILTFKGDSVFKQTLRNNCENAYLIENPLVLSLDNLHVTPQNCGTAGFCSNNGTKFVVGRSVGANDTSFGRNRRVYLADRNYIVDITDTSFSDKSIPYLQGTKTLIPQFLRLLSAPIIIQTP